MPGVELQAQPRRRRQQRQHGVGRRGGGERDPALGRRLLEGPQRVAAGRVEQLERVPVARQLGLAGRRGTRRGTSRESASAAPIRHSTQELAAGARATPASSSWSASTGVTVIVRSRATSSTGR